MEARGPQILIDDFTADDYLYYTIRFENTGTAAALNVRVQDYLEGAIDPDSFRMVSASHNYVLDRIGNQLTWRFENILLPAAVQDANGAKGYVQFKVKPLPGYSVGDMIQNTASIFFDYNPAIVTNTFATTFVESLGVDEYADSQFSIYPNPANDFINVKVKDGSLQKMTVYDLLGKTILEAGSSDIASGSMDISGVSSGIYLLEVVSDNNLKVTKKLIVK
jgi:uncharacterized repeat protein (TIGR01451 family)